MQYPCLLVRSTIGKCGDGPLSVPPNMMMAIRGAISASEQPIRSDSSACNVLMA